MTNPECDLCKNRQFPTSHIVHSYVVSLPSIQTFRSRCKSRRCLHDNASPCHGHRHLAQVGHREKNQPLRGNGSSSSPPTFYEQNQESLSSPSQLPQGDHQFESPPYDYLQQIPSVPADLKKNSRHSGDSWDTLQCKVHPRQISIQQQVAFSEVNSVDEPLVDATREGEDVRSSPPFNSRTIIADNYGFEATPPHGSHLRREKTRDKSPAEVSHMYVDQMEFPKTAKGHFS